MQRRKRWCSAVCRQLRKNNNNVEGKRSISEFSLILLRLEGRRAV